MYFSELRNDVDEHGAIPGKPSLIDENVEHRKTSLIF